MKCVNEKTIYTFEVSEVERVILMGLLNRVINKEKIRLNVDSKKTYEIILDGLRNTNCVEGDSDYVFEISEVNHLILMGLLSRVINQEKLTLDASVKKRFEDILSSLKKIND